MKKLWKKPQKFYDTHESGTEFDLDPVEGVNIVCDDCGSVHKININLDSNTIRVTAQPDLTDSMREGRWPKNLPLAEVKNAT